MCEEVKVKKFKKKYCVEEILRRATIKEVLF